MKLLQKIIFLILIASPLSAFANIDATEKWAWAEDIGWVNFNPVGGGVVVSGTGVTGSAWASNGGWIYFSPTNGGVTLTNTLVAGECISVLTGSAWGSNLGWIDFSGVFIDETGVFYGNASGVNTGDISFSGSSYALSTSLLPVCDPAIDSDGDGVSDGQEAIDGTDPNDNTDFLDTDNDGVPDELDPNPTDAGDALTDTDGDGVPDIVETLQGTDLNDVNDFLDTDGDGVPDYVESSEGTDSTDATDYLDTDGDGVPDYIETNSTPATDPTGSSDFIDTDGDGIPNAIDPTPNTPNPTELNDTDGDGVPDVVETAQGTDPNDTTDYQDSDGDGVPDYVEGQQGTDSLDSSDFTDTDGDGIPNAIDPTPNTPNPTELTDTDGDGVPDVVETAQGTDPNDTTDYQDSDGDGVSDYVEGQQGTDSMDITDFLDTDGDGVPDSIDPNPTTGGDTMNDTDGDGVPDVIEIAQGTDPNNGTNFNDSDNDGVSDFVENSGANLGDGDGDGIPDRMQQNVSGASNPVTGSPATLKSQGSCEFITENAFLAESSLAASDPTADYPVGLVDFRVVCTTPGDSTDVTIYYDQVYNTSGWSYKKYDSSGNIYADITSVATYGTALVGGSPVTTVSFTVTDGDPQTDEDGVVNGVIDDPSGPAVATISLSSSDGGSGGGGSSYDKCEGDDTSGSIYDGICSNDEETEEVISVISDTETSSGSIDESPEEDDIIPNTQGSDIPTGNLEYVTADEGGIEKTRIGSDGIEINYSLSNNYDSCATIRDITDLEYIYSTDIFTDITDSLYINEISKFRQAGIVNGYDDGTFRPTLDISRTEFLKVALQSHCLSYDTEITTNLDYVDTDLSSWQARVIARAERLGIINGDTLEINKGLINTNLGVGYSLERITELKKVLKGLGMYAGEVNGYYTDDLVDTIYNFQISQGIVRNQFETGAGSWGPSTRAIFFEIYSSSSYKVFRPDDVISKAEAVKILMRISGIAPKTLVENTYTDITTDWHIPYVRIGQTLGLFKPELDDFKFRPSSGIRRDNMVGLIHSLIKLYR